MKKHLWLGLGLLWLMVACNLPVRSTQVIQGDPATPTPLPPANSPTAEENTPADSADTCPHPDGWVEYTIQEGEDLLRVAVLTGSTIDDLVTANCLGQTMVAEVGQTIYVPNEPFPGDLEPVGSAEYYLIIPDDAGASGPPVGCGDSAQIVTTDVPIYGVPWEDIRASLEALFAVEGYEVGQSGLVNALSESHLTVQHISVANDTTVINLLGDLPLIGTCADARMMAQIMYTVFHHEGFSQVYITLNGNNLLIWFDTSGLVQPGDMVYRADWQ